MPTNVKVIDGNQQVTVTWSPPASAGSSPITRYQVTGTPNGSTSVNAPATSATLSNLPNGTIECVQVQAINAAGGGPLSPGGQVCTMPAPPLPPPAAPNAPTGLSITAGNGSLAISWTAATVGIGSPSVTSYQVAVAGATHTTTATSLTVGVPAWTNETVTVRAVNSVGAGSPASGSSAAWTRTGTVTCVDSLSGDHSVQNDCTNTGGAWTTTSSNVSWINPGGQLSNLHGNFEYLCATYESGGVSGDTYAIVGSPSQAACTAALPNYQAPDTPHVIAAVSTSSLGSGSQHICEYKGTTTGSSGKYTSEELSSSCTVPAGLAGASEVANFYT